MSTNESALSVIKKETGVELTFGTLLWGTRMGEDLTQAAVGDLLGVSRTYVCDLEKGRRIPTPRHAFEIAKALGKHPQQWAAVAMQDVANRDGLGMVVEFRTKATPRRAPASGRRKAARRGRQ